MLNTGFIHFHVSSADKKGTDTGIDFIFGSSVQTKVLASDVCQAWFSVFVRPWLMMMAL